MPRIAPINTLTTLQCQNVKGPAVLCDGRGLRLVVSVTNQRKWVLRVTVAGKQRDLGLGAFREVSLLPVVRQLAVSVLCSVQSRRGLMSARIFDALATLNAVMVASTFFNHWAFGSEAPWKTTATIAGVCIVGMTACMFFNVVGSTYRLTIRLFGKKQNDENT